MTDTTTNEPEIEIVSDDLYPWAKDEKERRRAFILEYFNFDPNIHIDAQLQQLNTLEKWLRGN